MSLAATRSRRLRLAQALAAAGRDAEARAHLLTLREGTPGDGLINLELARLAARDADVPHAAQYYRDAIEGAWDRAPDTRRREARLELADLLVRHGPPAAAEGELIALAADLPPDPGLHVRVGDLLMEAQQVRRAFDVYTAALRLDPASVRAAQGAGESAFPGQLRDRPTLLRAGCGRGAWQHTRARAARGRHRGDRPRSVPPRPQRPGTGTPRGRRVRDRVEAARGVRRRGGRPHSERRPSSRIAWCATGGDRRRRTESGRDIHGAWT